MSESERLIDLHAAGYAAGAQERKGLSIFSRSVCPGASRKPAALLQVSLPLADGSVSEFKVARYFVYA
jgi:hypothetical protein